MGNCHISDDLKEASLHMKARAYLTKEILAITAISRSTFQQVQQRKRLTSSIAKAQAICQGRPRTLDHQDIQYLLTLARHKPTLFLDEYTDHLADGHFLTVSMSTIH